MVERRRIEASDKTALVSEVRADVGMRKAMMMASLSFSSEHGVRGAQGFKGGLGWAIDHRVPSQEILLKVGLSGIRKC